MLRVVPVAAFLLIVPLLLPPLHAQTSSDSVRLIYGIYGGALLGYQSGEFPVFGSPGCGIFSGGSVRGVTAGLTLDLRQIPSLSPIDIHGRLRWEMNAARYAAAPLDEQTRFDSAAGELVTLQREYRYDITSHSLLLDLLAAWRATPHLSLALGGAAGVRIGSTHEQSDNILGPGEQSFSDGESRRAIPPGIRATTATPIFQWKFTAGYEIIPPRGFLFRPELFVQGDITPTVREAGWRSIAGGIGLSIMLRPAEPAPQPVIVPEPPRSPEPPTASLTLYGVDENHGLSNDAVITVSEVLVRQHTPFLPVVYFDSGSAIPSGRFTRLSRSDIPRFDYLDIAELGPLGLTQTALNLIALRMRDDSTATLALHGSRSLDEPTGLDTSRARAVIDYLTSVWRLPRSRMTISAAPAPLARSDEESADGRDENRRVVISSPSWEVMSPLFTERLIREFDPPRIKLVPVYYAAAGLRGWRIAVRQGKKLLAEFTDRDASAGSSSELAWRLDDDRIDSGLGVITAELTVEDSLGRSITAVDSIALTIRKNTRVVESGRTGTDRTERISYGLIAFDYGAAEGSDRHAEELTELGGMIRSSGRVTVVGYTDRIGDDRTNLDLSKERAAYAAERLRAAIPAGGAAVPIEIRGGGFDGSRYPNDLPEGRVLSRGVAITVEQPEEK